MSAIRDELPVALADDGTVAGSADSSGVPDVLFLNTACGESPWPSQAHTIGFDPVRQTVYAFLPESDRVSVSADLS